MAKALSLWQPYAAAIPLGYKPHETRSWSTNYRGKLIIASTASTPGRNAVIIPEAEERLYKMMLEDGKDGNDLWYFQDACVMAVVDLMDCFQITSQEVSDSHTQSRYGFLGDYSLGRWVWVLDNIQPINRFFAGDWKGRQGLYSPPQEGLQELLRLNPNLQL